jgi:hypothetical protein
MQLAGLMPDLAAELGHCRFHNCTHREEPQCGVRAAVEAGRISPSRWRIYGEFCSQTSCRARALADASGAGAPSHPSTLASDSSATSSIHSTTERQTRPTTLCR